MKNWLIARATTILFMVALAVSIGSRRIDAWKAGQPWAVGGVILFGVLVGWFLFPLVKRYLLSQEIKLSLWVALSILLGFIIWSFRPSQVSAPGDSIKIIYACDILSISLICLVVLVAAYEASRRLNGTSTLPDRLLISATYIYLAVPLVLFAFGWLKIGFAILFTVAIGFGLWKVGSDFEYRSEDTKEFLKFFLLSVLVAGVWVYFSGIGGYTFQNWDFEARNTVFHDLIKHSWPVEYDYRRVPEYRSIFGDTAALVYYFSFWLPSALVGKALGWLAANNMLYIWTVLGVALCFNLVARFTKIRKVWVLFLFMLWSGIDVFGQVGIAALTKQPPYLSLSALLQGLQIEWWVEPGKLFQYSAHTTQLFWVFNQALPTWIVTLLVLNQKSMRSLIFTSALIFLYAPLPAIGLAPFVVYKLFEAIPLGDLKTGYHQILSRLKEAVTSQNIISGGVLFFTAFLFFSANIGEHQHGFIWEFFPSGQLIYIYVLFCLVEFIPFVLLAWNGTDRSLLILISIVLFAIPLYKYGEYNDFAMRASIPALLILCLLFIQKLNFHFLSPASFEKNIRSAIFALVILFSAVTPFHEILHTRDMLVNSAPAFTDNWKTFDKAKGDADKQNMIANFVAGNLDEKLFFLTIGK